MVTPESETEQRDVVVFGGARPGRGPGRRRLRTLGLPVVLAAVVIAAVIARVNGTSGTVAAPSPSPSAAAPAPPPEPAATSGPPVVTEAGHPLLGVTAGWELFGRGPDGIVRIELARGRVTRTPVPPVGSSGPVSFLAGPGIAIIRPMDAVTGYAVPDGQPAQTLQGPLAAPGPALPGPDRAQLWVPQQNGGETYAMVLVGFDGRPGGLSIVLPPITGGYAQPDGGGHLMVEAVGGTYDIRPGSVRRITTGQVVAAGPTGWLTRECDAQLNCSTVFVDRDTWTSHVLGPAILNTAAPGLISPDGRTAAIPIQDAGSTTIHLVDTATGKDRRLAAPLPVSDDASIVWSPDSRWLFIAATDAHLHAIDRTGHDHDLGVRLPILNQLTIRP